MKSNKKCADRHKTLLTAGLSLRSKKPLLGFGVKRKISEYETSWVLLEFAICKTNIKTKVEYENSFVD